MSSRFAREDGGQALVIVALSFVALLGAVALGLDWGYGLTQRRVMVNSAEAGALAGAKLLATNVVTDANGRPGFTVAEEWVYCVALQAATANRDFRPGSPTETTVVEWNTDPQRRDAVTNEPIYTPFAKPAGPCPSPGTAITTGTVPSGSVRYVRVRTGVTYKPLLAAVLGQSSITAQGMGAARLTGAQPPDPGPTWPLMRHYNQDDFNTVCRAQCNPLTSEPVIFWSSNDDDLVYGQKKGLVDFSRYSPSTIQAAPPGYVCIAEGVLCVPQLLKSWDQRGDLADVTGRACSPPATLGRWLTRGNEDPQNWDKSCSIPNWAYHLFGGTLSLDKKYTIVNGAGEFREQPSPLSSTRAVCSTTVPVDKPSCGSDANIGDWVEVADSGNLGAGIADPLRRYIREQRQKDEWYDRPTPTGSGTYGYYAVITIYLWDCAETFKASGLPGEQWSLTLPKAPKTDCSDIHDGNDVRTGHSPDRVHVFTAVPFTFYEGLVAASEIKGFWGGKLGDPSACQATPTPPTCALNAVSNGVFLVPPD